MDPLRKGQDSLELFDFGVLLQALSVNLKVGVLAVRSGPREKFLHLDRATLRCVHARRPRVTLQKVLFNHRAVERGPLRIAADELGPERTEEQLADWLLERGCVTPEQLRRARLYQVIEEVLELFYWKNVGFEFHADTGTAWTDGATGRPLQSIGDPIAIDDVLALCAKTIDDIEKFNSVTPSLRDVYDLQFGSIQELERAVPDPAEREFMLLIDGLRDMRQVLADMRMNRFEALELFYKFRTEGRIRAKNAFELLMLAENRRQEFTWEKRMRVLERVNELGVEGFGVVLPLAETYEALERNDKAAECYARHARLAAQAEQTDDALRSVARAVELMPRDAGHQALAAELLHEAGRDAEAAAAYCALGGILKEAGDLDNAWSAIEHGARLAPADPSTRRLLGEILADRGERRLAAVRMRQAGDMYLAIGDSANAADCYARAIAVYPRGWSCRMRLADAHHAAGRNDLAVQVLSDHVAHVEDLAELGNDFCARRLAEAEERLRELGGFASSAARHLADAYRKFEREEDAGRALREGALTLLAARRPSSAVELCNDLIDICPEDHRARRIAARCHAALGDLNQALAQLRRVTGQLTRAGEWADAREVFQEMLEIDAGSLDGHVGLARSLLHTGAEEEATAHFHRAGLLHRGCGRAAQALPAFREAVAKRPGDALLLDAHCELLLAADVDAAETLSALSALVELRMGRGEHALAAATLTRILTIDEDYPGARDILRDAAFELDRLSRSSLHTAPSPADA